jgi:hypothetical protein
MGREEREGGTSIGRPGKRPCKNLGGQTIAQQGGGAGKETQVGAATQQDAGTKKMCDPFLSRFGPNTWNKDTHTYANPPIPFSGPKPGYTHPYGRLPSLPRLFEKFWTPKLQRRIVRETNRYASEVVDAKAGKIKGGLQWTPLGVEEFRAYLSICLLMGLKKLPCMRLYWAQNEPLFHCPVISQTMTWDRYEQITRCLHVANATESEKDRGSPTYDKLYKLRWMMDEVRDKFKSMWSPNQQMTVDESMVMYKGKYCPVRQYMPKKPVRLGIKVWATADAISKYLWNFEVYCGKDGNHYDEDVASDPDLEYGEFEGNDKQGVEKGNGLQGRNIVKDLMADLGGRGHIVITDNFFTSVPLYLDLLENGIMATGTLRANRKYVPRSMYAKKITKKKTMGWVDYRMHDEGKICCMVWKDKQAVYLLSTHAEPIPEEGTKPFVWRKIGGKRKKLRTGPMHLLCEALMLLINYGVFIHV